MGANAWQVYLSTSCICIKNNYFLFYITRKKRKAILDSEKSVGFVRIRRVISLTQPDPGQYAFNNHRNSFRCAVQRSNFILYAIFFENRRALVLPRLNIELT